METKTMTGDEQGYNGWANYETWLVSLWMDNDGTAEYFRERVEELGEDVDVSDLAEEISEWHDEAIAESLNDGSLPGFAQDIINAGLRAVDWHEIAQHYIDEEL